VEQRGHCKSALLIKEEERAYCLKIASLVATSSGSGRPNMPAILARTFWSMSGKSEENIVYVVSFDQLDRRTYIILFSRFGYKLAQILLRVLTTQHPHITMRDTLLVSHWASLVFLSGMCCRATWNVPKTPEPWSWPHKAIAFPPRLHALQHTCMRGMYPAPLLG
jgi:hypothetical protein